MSICCQLIDQELQDFIVFSKKFIFELSFIYPKSYTSLNIQLLTQWIEGLVVSTILIIFYIQEFKAFMNLFEVILSNLLQSVL